MKPSVRTTSRLASLMQTMRAPAFALVIAGALAPTAHANDSQVLLGGVGAAAGAIIGQKMGGSTGAVIGAGAGAVIGVSVAQGSHDHEPPRTVVRPVVYDRGDRDEYRHHPRGHAWGHERHGHHERD